MLFRSAVISPILAACLAVSAQAQDQPAAEPDAAEETSEAATAPDVRFERILSEWRALLERLRGYQQEFPTADDARKAAIRTEFSDAVRQGEALERKLIEAAERALGVPGESQKKAVDLLVGVLQTEVDADNYGEALRLGELLCDNSNDPRVTGLTGIAAFGACRFDTAERRLRQAVEQGAVSDRRVRAFLADVPEYKQAWATEQKIRAAEAEADDLPRVLLTTSKGDIEIELFENDAPMAVANFISLVEKGFYNGVIFHRVLPGFMAQGGCPEGRGTGGPGYHIPCECHKAGYRRHFQGSLSMAHAGRDTGGSQFFLTFLPTKHLDGRHTVFGRVIGGMDVLAKLQRRDPERPDQTKPDQILAAKVIRKRDHAYEPTKVR